MKKMKPWYQSRTLWVNFFMMLGALAEANLGMLQGLLGPKVYYFAILLAGGVNFWLRALTTMPITGAPIVPGEPKT